MNNDFKKLYEMQEELIAELTNAIDIHSKTIEALQTENKLLTQENQHLREQNRLLTEVCEEQQGWVKKFLQID